MQQLRLLSAKSACGSPSVLRCRMLPSTSEHRAGEPECQAVRGTWVHCSEPSIWATWRLATLLRGTQAARHGEAMCRLCTALLLCCAMQCTAVHGPRGNGLACRRTSNTRDAKQMAARRSQALGSWAIAESDVLRTDSKTWYALLKSVSHTNAQNCRVHGASDSSLACRFTCHAPHAKQRVARRFQVVGTRAVTKSDVPRTGLRTWYGRLYGHCRHQLAVVMLH